MYFEYWVSPTADIMKDGVGGQEDWGKPNERLGIAPILFVKNTYWNIEHTGSLS